MKIKSFLLSLVAILIINISVAQEISRSEVPSIILNKFNNQFSKAKDVEWEKGYDFYKVEFEASWGLDHDVWYNENGEMIKHKEELMSKNLPRVIKTDLKSKYKNYLIDDVEKITEGNKITYKVEIEKLNEEVTLFYNEDGSILKVK